MYKPGLATIIHALCVCAGTWRILCSVPYDTADPTVQLRRQRALDSASRLAWRLHQCIKGHPVHAAFPHMPHTHVHAPRIDANHRRIAIFNTVFVEKAFELVFVLAVEHVDCLVRVVAHDVVRLCRNVSAGVDPLHGTETALEVDILQCTTLLQMSLQDVPVGQQVTRKHFVV